MILGAAIAANFWENLIILLLSVFGAVVVFSTTIFTARQSMKAARLAAATTRQAEVIDDKVTRQGVVIDGVHVLVNSAMAQMQIDLRAAVAQLQAMTTAHALTVAAQAAATQGGERHGDSGAGDRRSDLGSAIAQFPAMPADLARIIQRVENTNPTTGEQALDEERHRVAGTTDPLPGLALIPPPERLPEEYG